MGESHHHYHQQAAAPSSRLGIRGGGGGGGEIVEVQGGHIVRSTGRKDRHSKVCTAKGPRDRRVRLSAHTAIQFYDVQDRLGYDRPSKAVDWLIKKAKTAIDELAELPPWTPTSTIATAVTASANPRMHQEEEEENEFRVHGMVDSIAKKATAEAATMVDGDNVRIIHSNSSSFLPPSLDSDSIADTIKSFFPIGAEAEAETPSSSMQFQNYPPDLLSRTSSQSQDLRLSLQSFQDPMLLHHHQQAQNQATQQQSEYVLFSGTGTVGFDSGSGGWPHHHQRLFGWNAGSGADTGNGGGGGGGSGGFMFHAPPTQTFQPPLQPLIGHNQFFSSQRGPLQSSNTPSIRAWMDPSIAASDHQIQQAIHQSSISGIGYASGGFSGFQIPARIQGEEEHDGGISNKPPSASSDSRH